MPSSPPERCCTIPPAASMRASSNTRPSVWWASCWQCRELPSRARTSILARRSASRSSRASSAIDVTPTVASFEQEVSHRPAGRRARLVERRRKRCAGARHGDAPGALRRHDRCGLGSGGRWTHEREGNAQTVDAALLAEAFGDEIVFERPPQAVQEALARTVAPIARRRGRSVTREIMRAAIIQSDAGRHRTTEATPPRHKRRSAAEAKFRQAATSWGSRVTWCPSASSCRMRRLVVRSGFWRV